MFIQYLAEQGHNVVKSERKPRKTVQYKDLGELQSMLGRGFTGLYTDFSFTQQLPQSHTLTTSNSFPM